FAASLIREALVEGSAEFAAGFIQGLTGSSQLSEEISKLTKEQLGTYYDVNLALRIHDILTQIYEADQPVTGTTLDGYLTGATVFADQYGDRELHSGEPFGLSDNAGEYDFVGSRASLIAVGGVDLLTGLPFRGQISAPTGSAVISPLTTLLDDL